MIGLRSWILQFVDCVKKHGEGREGSLRTHLIVITIMSLDVCLNVTEFLFIDLIFIVFTFRVINLFSNS